MVSTRYPDPGEHEDWLAAGMTGMRGGFAMLAAGGDDAEAVWPSAKEGRVVLLAAPPPRLR